MQIKMRYKIFLFYPLVGKMEKGEVNTLKKLLHVFIPHL